MTVDKITFHYVRKGKSRTKKPHREGLYYLDPGTLIKVTSNLKGILYGHVPFAPHTLSLNNPWHVTFLLCRLSYDELFPYRDTYIKNFADFIINLYDDIHSPAGKLKPKKFKRFPLGFWAGYQGLTNLMILTRHVLEEDCLCVYGKKFDQSTPQEQIRMFSASGQNYFLLKTVKNTEKTWMNYLSERKLNAGLDTCHMPVGEYFKLLPPALQNVEKTRLKNQKEINLSISLLFQLTFPDLFSYWNTPPNQHVHPWDIMSRINSWEDAGLPFAVNAVKHVLEHDLGLIMNEHTQTIDERLLDSHGRRFLDHHHFKKWEDLFYQTGLYFLPTLIPEFEGSQVTMMRKVYPWAFKLFDAAGNPTPPGKHLDYWKLFPRVSSLWKKDSDIIEAVRHEWLSTGKNWDELPQSFKVKWLKSDEVGLQGVLEHFSIRELVLLCFPDEVKQGKIKIEKFKHFSEGKEANNNPLKLVDSRGRVIIDQRRFYLPKRFGDGTWAVRRLEMNTAGIFKIVQKNNRRTFELTYTFEIKPNKTWIKEEDLK